MRLLTRFRRIASFLDDALQSVAAEDRPDDPLQDEPPTASLDDLRAALEAEIARQETRGREC